MKALLRGTLATLVGSVTLFVASTALADGEACYNDTDCPGTACGDAVCNWSKTATTPMGEKMFYCNPAGTQAKKADGWCTTDDNCKCKGLGAKCVGTFCTFTKPGDAPAGSSGSSAGGAAPTAGTTSTPTAGTTTAGTASGGTGSTTPAPAASSGGCSLSVPGGSNTGLALGVGLLGLGLAFARRRR